MNVFSKNRITGWGVVILVLLNLALLVTIWFNRPGEVKPPAQQQGIRQGVQQQGVQQQGQGRGQGQQRRLAEFLVRELQFTRDQMERFKEMREQHHLKVQALRKNTMDLRKELMNELLAEEADMGKVRNLSQAMGETFRQIEETTFDHFHALVDLCTPDQKPQFKQLLHEILEMMKPPEHRRPPRRDGQRPRPGGPPHDRPPPH